jgi:segregation and condensation protein A
VGEEDLGESLARQLRIYKRFKELSNWLDDREKLHLKTYIRLAPPPKIDGRIDLSDISLHDLMTAAEEIYADVDEKSALGTVISAPLVTIREKIALISDYLVKNHNASFSRLLGKEPTRLEIVVTFLALLELVKRYRVSALQEKLFSDIQIEKLEEWRTDEDLEIEFE